MSNNLENEHNEDLDDEEYDENEIDETDEMIDPIPSCPYCSDDSANCKHVILHYDASFKDYLSGFLVSNGDEFFEQLDKQLNRYIKNGVQKKHRDKNLHNFICYAFETSDETRDNYSFDSQLFLYTLGDFIIKNGGDIECYSDSESAATFSSSYAIYFAKNPKKLLKDFIKFVSDEFNN